MTTADAEKYKDAVRVGYAEAAKEAQTRTATGAASGLIGRSLYEQQGSEALPEGALAASLGCGNPTLLADLRQGEVVLDLGSGGGVDVLLSARRVGPTGQAYGLDMTDEMLERARANQYESGLTNVEFLKGNIEDVPLPDSSVDVIISNCAVNLSPDKEAVFREAFRVLKPGGRLAISDIVLRHELPELAATVMRSLTGCMAGALSEARYSGLLQSSGFRGVGIKPTQVYNEYDLVQMAGEPIDADGLPPATDMYATIRELDGVVMSPFVRARKVQRSRQGTHPARREDTRRTRLTPDHCHLTKR